MPTYNYECKKCGHRLEAWQRMSDEPLKECPECKELELKKVIAAGDGGFQLKGSGWFKTGGY